MTNKELNSIIQIVFMVKDVKSLQEASYEEVAIWTAKQLHDTLGINSAPIGILWLANTTEEGYKHAQSMEK